MDDREISHEESAMKGQGARHAPGARTCQSRASSSRPRRSRREFLAAAASTGVGVTLATLADRADAQAADQAPAARARDASYGTEVHVTLQVNGQAVPMTIEPRVTLLDALRERAGLTGAKKGCDHGQCGACTVHIDGRRVLSCLTLAIMHQDQKITTIEGLADGENLHPMQAAFVARDGLQCGFCTPGQIMSAVALVEEGHARTEAEIKELMSGNICRCGAYPNIVAAVREVMEGKSNAAV
jgi:xanthine dehydrogenase YagT iron-sulfur-binding subunit